MKQYYICEILHDDCTNKDEVIERVLDNLTPIEIENTLVLEVDVATNKATVFEVEETVKLTDLDR